jgi:hypothetical protein
MIMVQKSDLDPKLNLEGLKRGDRVEMEIDSVTPMGLTVDPKTLKLNGVRDLTEPRAPLVKPPKVKNAANMPLPALKNMIQQPMPNPMPPISGPAVPPPAPIAPTPIGR